jgi:hypothetical protein
MACSGTVLAFNVICTAWRWLYSLKLQFYCQRQEIWWFTYGEEIHSIHVELVVVKVMCPTTRHEGAWGERRYSSCLFLTSTLDCVSDQRHASAALYPRGKDPWYPFYRRLSGTQSRSGHRDKRKTLCLCRGSNPDRQVVQYTILPELPGSQTNSSIPSNKQYIIYS